MYSLPQLCMTARENLVARTATDNLTVYIGIVSFVIVTIAATSSPCSKTIEVGYPKIPFYPPRRMYSR